MAYSIELPNGILVEDIPDDIPKDEVRRRIIAKFPELAPKEVERTWGEAGIDTGAGLLSGVGSLLQVPGQLGSLAGLTAPEEKPTGLQGVGKGLEDYAQSLKSTALKGKEAARAKKISEQEGFLNEFGTAFKETITDPALLGSFVAETIPNFIGSFGGGLAARGVTKVLLSDAIKSSLGAERVSNIVGKAGLTGSVGTGAVMQGVDIGSDTYEELYKRLIKDGKSESEAQTIALTQGRKAAIEAFGISVAASLLPGGSAVERALAGKGMEKTGGFAKGLIGEAVSEGIEEGGGKYRSNVAQNEIYPDVDTMKGVGAATGLGVLGGGIFGGLAEFSNQGQPAAKQGELPPMPSMPVDANAPVGAPNVSPVPLTQARYMPLNADEARQQSYEQQVGRQNAAMRRAEAASAGTPYDGQVDRFGNPAPLPKDKFGQPIIMPPTDPFTGYNTQPLRDTVSKDDRLNDPNRPAPPAPASRVPMTEELRIAKQRAAQQQNDIDTSPQTIALRQAQNPNLNPAGFGAGRTEFETSAAESQPRQSGKTVTPAQARRIDRQSKLLGQMDGLPQVEQAGLNAQADIAAGTGKPGGPGQKVPAQTRFVALEAMTPREARQRLAVLKEELKTEEMPAELAQFRKQGLQGPVPKNLREPNRSLHIVPHPTIGGRYAIEERVKQTQEAPEPRRADRVVPSWTQTLDLIEDVKKTGIITPEVLSAAKLYNFNLDPIIAAVKQKQTAPDIISQQRQGMADEAALNAELRGGVATPEEAQRIREQGMGRPYDQVQQTGPESRELGLSERERRLNAEDEAARLKANTDPEAIARRRFHEKLQGPELWLEGFDVNPNAEPGPASQEFIDQFLKPEGRFSLTATPAMKEVLADPKPLLAMLKRFGLGKVGLRLVDSIRNGTAEGQYAQ